MRETLTCCAFALLLFLQLIFSGSTFQYYFLIGNVALFFYFLLNIDWKIVKNNNLYLWLWIGFFLAVFAASLTTHSFPLTLYQLGIYAQSFLFFLFFVTTNFTAKGIKLCLLAILLSVGIAAIFSIVISLTTDWGSHLPPMTLLYPVYGHSHLSALLVLLYPLSFYFAFKQSEHKKLWILIFFLYTAAQLISLGRISIFLACIQCVFVFYGSRKFFRKKRKLVILSVVSFASLLVMMGVLVYVSFFRCPSFILDTQATLLQSVICKKTITNEPRFYYWKQAAQAMLNYPVTGYGPGTFRLISDKYKQIPNLKTIFAHNEYISFFAESGFFSGVLFISVLLLPILGFLRQIVGSSNDSEKSTWHSYLLLGYSSFLILLFFDYSLQFLPVQIIFFSVLGIISRAYKITYTDAWGNSHSMYMIIAIKLIYLLCMGMFIFWLFIQIGADRNHIFMGKHVRLFEPHSMEQMKNESLSKKESDLARKLYIFHPFMTNLLDKEKQKEVDPWSFVSDLKSSERNPTPSVDDFIFAEKLIANSRGIYSHDDFLLEKVVSTRAHLLAKELWASGKTQSAKEYYYIASRIHFWSMHKFRLPINEIHPTQEDCDFLQKMLFFPIEPFGDSRAQASEGYARCANIYASSFPLEEITQFLKQSQLLSGKVVK